jgi:hypothetical protein
MEGFVATKLDEFDRGRISRRRLIETLTLAATSAYAADAAKAQAPGLKVALVNHISYSCPNFRQAGDWYSKVFNLDQVGLKETEVTLPFGKMGEQPYNVSAKDVPLTFIISRAIDRPANPRNAGRPKPEAVIDHVAYTVADFNRERAKAELIAMGVKNVREGGPYSLHLDDPFGFDVQISGLENNAITDGG